MAESTPLNHQPPPTQENRLEENNLENPQKSLELRNFEQKEMSATAATSEKFWYKPNMTRDKGTVPLRFYFTELEYN